VWVLLRSEDRSTGQSVAKVHRKQHYCLPLLFFPRAVVPRTHDGGQGMSLRAWQRAAVAAASACTVPSAATRASSLRWLTAAPSCCVHMQMQRAACHIACDHAQGPAASWGLAMQRQRQRQRHGRHHAACRQRPNPQAAAHADHSSPRPGESAATRAPAPGPAVAGRRPAREAPRLACRVLVSRLNAAGVPCKCDATKAEMCVRIIPQTRSMAASFIIESSLIDRFPIMLHEKNILCIQLCSLSRTVRLHSLLGRYFASSSSL
jgi:hypothetical protein